MDVHSFYPSLEKGEDVAFTDLGNDSFILSGKLPRNICPVLEDMLAIRPTIPDTVIMAGKPVLTPRFVAHYLKPYYYTGRIHPAKPLPELLIPLLQWCNEELLLHWKEKTDGIKENDDSKFNQVLVNYYMNGLHYIGKHSDDERQSVKNSPIFSCTFGQERTFRISTKSDGGYVMDIPLIDGTFILMCGKMQKHFKHEVLKVTGRKGENMGPRVNVTLRMFLTF
jgi:alkylated DNA repair dioxygenase AlkB